MNRTFLDVNRALALVLVAAAAMPLAVPGAQAAKKGKPAPKPTATPTPTPKPEPEPEPKPEPKAAAKVEYGACPVESLAETEPEALVTFMRKRCRNLKVPAGAAPTDLSDDEMLVALCVREKEAVETKECALKASVQLADESASVSLSADGELALAAKTTKVESSLKPQNGTQMTLVITYAEGDGKETKTARSPLVWRKGTDPYGKGTYLWFPLPMFTTDFSASPAGYRFGITPIALAFGTRIHPSAGSRAYFGISAFGAWNLLIPNDTQTLSNGTSVRVNYKSLGVGLLLDAAGYVAFGFGVGKTFTTDSRTDFRTWIYLGPRLLGFLNELN